MIRRAICLGVAAGCLMTLGLSRPVGASGGLTFDSQVTAGDGRGEPEVAVDVNNPRDLVDAYTNGTSVSVDGGLHWRQVRPGQSDPVVVADGSGDFFASGLGSFTSGPGSSEYQFSESRDHGTSWASVGGPLHNPLPAGWSVPDTSVNPSGGPLYMGPSAVGCDRPLSGADLNTGALFASCADHGDPAGGERGDTWPAYFVTCRSNVFAAEGTPNCGRRYVSVSHDHGKAWSAWQPEDSADYPAGYTGAFGGIPVGAHGVLATAYVAGAAPGSDCSQCAIFQTSTDEGKTWSRHLVAGATPQIQTFTTANPTTFGSSDNQSVWFEPYVAADPSRPGRFAIMILDGTRTELLVYVTTDSGAHWSGPAVLGDGTHRVDKPAFAYGPTGALGAMWKSVYSSDLSFDVWAAVSPGGGLAFGHAVRLNSQRSKEETCGLGGSEGQAYACDELSWMVMDPTHLDATWGDNRNAQNPWFGRYAFAADSRFRR